MTTTPLESTTTTTTGRKTNDLIVCGSYERLLYGLSLVNDSPSPSSLNVVASKTAAESEEMSLTSTLNGTQEVAQDVASNLELKKSTSSSLNSGLVLKEEEDLVVVADPAVNVNVDDSERMIMLDSPPSPKKKESLTPSFIYPSHLLSLTALSLSRDFLATGSGDELVKLYNLRIRKEVGILSHHVGTITKLHWITPPHSSKTTHLVTAGADGKICLVRKGDWEVLKELKGHVGPVLDFDIHPSGKVLLSVGKDNSLKLYDLTRALLSYSFKPLPSPSTPKDTPVRVKWSLDGLFYVCGFDHSLSVFRVGVEGGRRIEVPKGGRINAMVCMETSLPSSTGPQVEGVVVFGGEDKILHVASLETCELLGSIKTPHLFRIKDLALRKGGRGVERRVASCSSEGLILLWDIQLLLDSGFSSSKMEDCIMARYEANVRLTCLDFMAGDEGYARMEGVKKREEVQKLRDGYVSQSDYEGDIKAMAAKKAGAGISVTLEEEKVEVKKKKKVQRKRGRMEDGLGVKRNGEVIPKKGEEGKVGKKEKRVFKREKKVPLS